MHRSADAIRSIRETAVRTVRGVESETQVDEWSIDVLHRVRTAPEGAATRVIWTRGPAGRMDRVVEGRPRVVHEGFVVWYPVDTKTGEPAKKRRGAPSQGLLPSLGELMR